VVETSCFRRLLKSALFEALTKSYRESPPQMHNLHRVAILKFLLSRKSLKKSASHKSVLTGLGVCSSRRSSPIARIILNVVSSVPFKASIKRVTFGLVCLSTASTFTSINLATMKKADPVRALIKPQIREAPLPHCELSGMDRIICHMICLSRSQNAGQREPD
jgi:hypothetical protein